MICIYGTAYSGADSNMRLSISINVVNSSVSDVVSVTFFESFSFSSSSLKNCTTSIFSSGCDDTAISGGFFNNVINDSSICGICSL